MNYTFEDAVKLISQKLEQMKSAPPQKEQDEMNYITGAIIIKILRFALATIIMLMISAVVLCYILNNTPLILLIIPVGILCMLLSSFFVFGPLYNNKNKLGKKFNKEYKEFCEKYKYPDCSQESYEREIIKIIKNTDVYIIESNKTGMVQADVHISEVNEPDHVSVTFYYYDGCDENFQPKYKTQEIKFI